MLGAITVAAVAIYLPSVGNGWVWDDPFEIVDNKLIHSWAFVWKSFIHDLWWFRDPARLPQSPYYRPLQNAWFAANAMLFGMHPALWHLAMIVLHAAAVWLCFRVAQLLTGEVAVGLLTAAIFAAMPAHVGAVVFASAIPEPLSAVFELGALSCFIQRKPGCSRGLIAALLLYACAALTHESAILFPLIITAYVFLFEAGEQTAAGAVLSASRAAAPFLLVAIAYLCARINALGINFLVGLYNPKGSMIRHAFFSTIPMPHHGPAELLMTIPVAAITYLAVLAIPAMAGPAHAVQWITHPQPILFVSVAALLIFGAAALTLAWRSSNRRIYLFCAAFSLVTIAPALNLNGLWWLVDDRYLYAPSFGWSLGLAVAASEIARAGARTHRAVGAATALILALYAASTMQTERYWHDDVSFFKRCVQIAPDNSDFALELAGAMNQAGDRQGATRELERITVLHPSDANLHLKLAQQYRMMGRELDFEREFGKYARLSARGS